MTTNARQLGSLRRGRQYPARLAEGMLDIQRAIRDDHLTYFQMAVMIAATSAPPTRDDDVPVRATIGAFDSTLLVHQAGIRTIAVTDETDTAHRPEPRSLSFKAIVHASDGGAYHVGRIVDLTEHEQTVVHLRLYSP